MARKHTILGATGIIGRTLAETLAGAGEHVRLVDRSDAGGRPDHLQADLLDSDQAQRAVEGADVVHFVVGLPYDDRLWEKNFPPIMGNVLTALEGSSARLVFMDNVYMYGKVDGPQTEDAPHAATTRKGQTRANLVQQVEDSGIDWTIARSADFYGPGANTTSALNLFVLANLKAGKPANWLGSADLPHAFTYTRDIAVAMATLADADGVSHTTWHVPTAPARTVRELARIATAATGGGEPEFEVLDKATVEQYAKGDAVMAATAEMFYQFDSPYIFDSSRYERRFGASPTSYEEGVRASVEALA